MRRESAAVRIAASSKRAELLAPLAALLVLFRPERCDQPVTGNPMRRRERLEHDYDLILLDLQMPAMNGFEVIAELQQIRAAHPV